MNNEEKILEILGSMQQEMRTMNSRMDGMETRMDGIETRMGSIETRMDGMETRMDKMETRMDGMETRMGGMETRMGGMETRMGGMETRMGGMDRKIDQTRQDMITLLDAEFTKKFNLLAESIDLILERLPEDGFRENVNTRLDVLETVTYQHGQEIAALKRAN